MIPREPTATLATLAFTRPEDVVEGDLDRGVRRARTLDPARSQDPGAYDRRTCTIHDCSALADFRPELRVHGFDRVALTGSPRLQAHLERVRVAGFVEATDAAAIRRALLGRSLPLAGGGRLRPLFVAREGFLMRKAGPGSIRHSDGERRGINGHDAAVAVHADQDVDGTPVRQILRGAAPWIFHHHAPTHDNTRSRIVLVNLWIGLDQVTRPLALMDQRTLDRRAHQLRYGMPTDGFLARRPDMRINDLWTFLHDDAQRWYFTSALDAGAAYVFETLSTPHASFILPGEARAESRYSPVIAAVTALAAGDRAGARGALAAIDDDDDDDDDAAPVTAPLRQALADLKAQILEGRAILAAAGSDEAARAWAARAQAVADRLVRKSIEMRVVALYSPPRG